MEAITSYLHQMTDDHGRHLLVSGVGTLLLYVLRVIPGGMVFDSAIALFITDFIVAHFLWPSSTKISNQGNVASAHSK